MRFLLLYLPPLVLACAACGGTAGGDGESGSPESLARAYVQAIDETDGETLCALFVEGAVMEAVFPGQEAPCPRTIEALVGYVEDAGSPQFLGYPGVEVTSAGEHGDYASVGLSLEARFDSAYGTQGGQIELCRFEDTVWFTKADGGWRIAKPSLALWAAFGALEFPPDALWPPGARPQGGGDARLARSELLTCRPDAGEGPAAEPGEKWTPGSVAQHLAKDPHFEDVTCFDNGGRDGWDFVCTYFDPTLGRRMKTGQRIAAGGLALVGGGSVPEDQPLPPGS